MSFNPYDDNGGSVVAIAGEDYALIASDTRLSTGFSIYTREQTKMFKLPNNSVLGSTGCWCDTLTLTKILDAKMKMYLYNHNEQMSTPATAQMLSIMMYYRRFFPYYVSNTLAGLDAEGKGCVYSYDPIGNCLREKVHAGGSSGSLLQPLLDCQLGKDMVIPLELAKTVAKDVFVSAAERDIYTGDFVLINVITKDGITEERISLRKD